MSRLPSVLVGDVLSPQASEQVSLITSNLNQAADRAAQAALQHARIKAEKEMQEKAILAQQETAEMELEAKVKEYETFRTYQSLEAEKARAHDKAINADREAAADKRQSDVLTAQEKLAKQANELKMAEWDISARKAKAAADEATSLEEKLAPIKEQRGLLNQQLAALEIELGESEGQAKIDLAAFDKFQSELNQSRTMAGTAGNQATVQAIQDAISDVILSEPGGLKKTIMEAARTSPNNMMAGVGAQLASNVFWSMNDENAPVAQNALTNAGAMADKLVNKLAPKFAALTKNGTQADVQAALTNFMSQGIIAQQALASDGVIKGADEEAAVENFTKAAAQLSGYVGNEVVQGMMKGLSTAASDYSAGKLATGKQSKTSRSTQKARGETFKQLARIGDVYQMARNKPGSPIAGAEYDEDMSGFINKLVAAKADRSWSTEEFKQDLKKLGVDANLLRKIVAHYEGAGSKEVPANVLRKMKDVLKEQEGLGLDVDIEARLSEARAIKAGATEQAAAIDEYRAILGGP